MAEDGGFCDSSPSCERCGGEGGRYGALAVLRLRFGREAGILVGIGGLDCMDMRWSCVKGSGSGLSCLYFEAERLFPCSEE